MHSRRRQLRYRLLEDKHRLAGRRLALLALGWPPASTKIHGTRSSLRRHARAARDRVSGALGLASIG